MRDLEGLLPLASLLRELASSVSWLRKHKGVGVVCYPPPPFFCKLAVWGSCVVGLANWLHELAYGFLMIFLWLVWRLICALFFLGELDKCLLWAWI
ncbi:hypothetical protein BKH46_02045 [Helicobacter sp. 12S02634-8]|nr:hypothetical protein BKH46_02045 [Helicobacter sp. 12S02634-8]